MNEKSIWQPITDLPSSWAALCSTDLGSLAPIWREQAARLRNTKVFLDFNERLKRQWAIETGIIEGLYSIDRGTTMLLIEHGLELSLLQHGSTDRPPERVLDIVLDQQTVLEYLFEFIGGTRQLTTSYIKELHALFTRHQASTEAIDALGRRVEVELLRGDWKKSANNPRRNGHVFTCCPPEHVAAEMDQLIVLHRGHEGVCPEVEAAWLHHRFTQIHPFQDGNGRVARALASLVFIKEGWFPLTITRDDRKAYIDALEAADEGDLQLLVQLFARIQKAAFLRAVPKTPTP
jgi:Fic family protein